MSKLRVQWKNFADEYIISGNIYKSALKAGYSENYAKGNAAKLLENVSVKDYIEERLEEIKSQKVADQQEIMEFLTSVMRGEVSEEQLLTVKEGFDEHVELHTKHPDVNNRTKAAQMLGKRYAMWVDKGEVDISQQIVFQGGDQLED
ncbi:terminase small subunit [Desemzia sp. C1]|uniref:terminase small subunit n=1 Tax=Desemzia sp. C1 TaxID=2892016 RepID=UPI001E2CE7F0|nr:terminase small subunit [Desemzia sp. C1]